VTHFVRRVAVVGPPREKDIHMAKATKPAAKRGSGKRELVKNAAGDFFARRTAGGQFKEMDERGRSLAKDRRTKARTVAPRGRGDKGDRAR
jgi:hypothetical protein